MSDETPATLQTRTHAVAMAEVRFGVEYGSLNERLWRHVDTSLNLFTVLCGALALAGALSVTSWLAAAAGVALAINSALQITWQPLKRSIEFRDARFAFHDLARRAGSMPLAELDAALEDLRRAAPIGSDWLLMPAQNRVHAQFGHAPARALNWRERLASAMA